ncbi:hypothetical protein [Methanothrix harundinacea]|uniref:hypothetical protein n=1 Tax=Methanothrix harundinacea TaxID=301375 RepID=UPI000A6DC6DF|nr:hypothetical protein [Methanothrix harundinacea]
MGGGYKPEMGPIGRRSKTGEAGDGAVVDEGVEPLHSFEKSTGDEAIYIWPSYFISIDMNNREDLR